MGFYAKWEQLNTANRLRVMSIAKQRGNRGEALARAFFTAQGWVHRASNYRSRWGEIDLILQDKQTLVFVEVKYRRSARYGKALESLSATQQKRLLKTAQDFLLRNPHTGPWRFDLLALQEKNGQIVPQHISNALEVNATY